MHQQNQRPLFKQFPSLVILIVLLLSLPAGSVAAAAKPPAKPSATPTAPYVMDKPSGWTLTEAGECDTLALHLRNPADPLQQLFFFARFGPVYMSQEQKMTDLQYEAFSGQSLHRLDMPVVQPLNPENFSRFLPQILQMQTMREFMPERPGLRVVEPVAVLPQKKALDFSDAQTAVVRILFVQENRLGEGLIVVTTVSSPEFRSAPGGGIGMGYLLYGVTAPKGALAEVLPSLLAAGRSFRLGADYAKKCDRTRAEDAPELLKDGQSLRAAVDAMAAAWDKRPPADDMAAEKKSDALRGVERLHRPGTGEVFEFPAGFSSEYQANPSLYTVADLRPLPDEPALWLKKPEDGLKTVTRK